jgi:hypothetical protein
MVDHLPDSIAKDSYFIPFITFQGKSGYETDIKKFKTIEFKRDTSSIEYQLHSLKVGCGFINFKALKEDIKLQMNSLHMYPWNNLIIDGKWTNVYDGAFFIDTMSCDVWKRFTTEEYEYFNRILYKQK